MKKALLIISLFTISACTPSAPAAPTADLGAVQTRAVQTAFAQQTKDVPTATVEPTKPINTALPTVTLTKQATMADMRQSIVDAVITDLATFEDVESVSVARFNNGVLEIELKTVWASQDRQPDVSWKIISAFAGAYGKVPKTNMFRIAGGPGPFAIQLTTYSTDGGYRYQSVSDWDTLAKLASKSMSYEEWVTTSGAGFK